MTTDKFLETKTFNIKNPLEGYIIPYVYLKTLLDEYAKLKVNELNKADVGTLFLNFVREQKPTTENHGEKINLFELERLVDKFNVSGYLPELFRNFIITHHLTSKWEQYLKDNEGNLR